MIKNDFKEKFIFDKRKVVIMVITILSCLVISLLVFSIILYNSFNQYKKLYEPSTDIPTVVEEKTYTSTEILNQINNLFNNKSVLDIDDEKLKENLIKAYIDTVDDKYAKYYTAEEYSQLLKDMAAENVGIGVSIETHELGIKVIKVFKNSPAETAGLQPDDIITGANGESFAGITLAECQAKIKNSNSNDILFSIKRGETSFDITITKASYTYETVTLEYKEINSKKIAIVTIDAFYENTYNEFKTIMDEIVLSDAEGIIYDLRDNGGGYLSVVCNMLDYILPEGPIVKLVYKDTTNEDGTRIETLSSDETYVTNLPMVVLVNSNTASASELFTSCLKDYERATIIGTTTYGKGCGQNIFKLSDGSYIKITNFMYNPPYSDNFNGIGITPDIEITLDEKYKGRSVDVVPYEDDYQLQKGLEELTK